MYTSIHISLYEVLTKLIPFKKNAFIKKPQVNYRHLKTILPLQAFKKKDLFFYNHLYILYLQKDKLLLKHRTSCPDSIRINYIPFQGDVYK